MNTNIDEARLAVDKAREALRNGDRTAARQWAEHAASLAPEMEDPWLILAAVASPRASLEYIQTALKINPSSERARQGLEWATQRLQATPPARETRPPAPAPAAPAGPAARNAGTGAKKRNRLVPVVLLALGCLLCIGVAWSALSSPVASYLISALNHPVPAETHPQVWAQVSIPKPTYTPSSLTASQATPTAQSPMQPTIQPTQLAAVLPTRAVPPQNTAAPANSPAPTAQNTAAPANFPAPTAQIAEVAPTPAPTYSGSISMAILPDTPTSAVPTSAPPATAGAPSQAETLPLAEGAGVRWIDVNLSQQMVYAYQGASVVNSFLVSTGTWQYPTVTGEYHIYVKLLYTDMTGPGYYLPNVPYTMYFYQGYGLHGTYWHHNFGTPMSHGCVNLSIPDAEWLYDWASVGTLVNVHY